MTTPRLFHRREVPRSLVGGSLLMPGSGLQDTARERAMQIQRSYR